MTDILFAPHHDDETIFAAYLALEYHPLVVVCLRSQVQDVLGIRAEEREAETAAAMEIFGCEWWQWSEPDVRPDAGRLRLWMQADLEQYAPERVFAPAVEENGHEQHNLVGQLALDVFGERVTSYLTYTRGGGRSTWGRKLEPEPEWIAAKHRALACYASQIREPSTRPWFVGDLHEYVA